MDVKLAVKIKSLQREADALGVKITSDPPLTILEWEDVESDESIAKYKGFTLYCNLDRQIYSLDCADGTTIQEFKGSFDLFEQEAIALVDSIVDSIEKSLLEDLKEGENV